MDTLGDLGRFQHLAPAFGIGTGSRLRALGNSIGRSYTGQMAIVDGLSRSLELPVSAGVLRCWVSRFAVECERDPKRGEIPARFGWPDRMRQVVELIDRWEGDEDIYFRVRTEDASTYILRQNRISGVWQIHFFRRGSES